jgi:uncharacterized protein (DUF362 family)
MFKSKITRRRFIHQTGIASAAIAGSTMLPGFRLLSSDADISIINGPDYYNNTIRAVELIGGMKKFVPERASVGLLINSDFTNHGAFVNPDIPIAVINLIREAGAGEITCLQSVKKDYWQRSRYYEKNKEAIASLKQVESNTFPSEFNDEDFVLIREINGAKSLPETEVVNKWLECDVFINIPIAKHHPSTHLTCALKNIMGVSTRKANVSFHLGSGVRNDPDYLAQCIADQHLLRKTDLCIIDATEFITDNGPNGPGTIKSLQKIVAGTDIVALDALAVTFLDCQPDENLTVLKAHDAGIGNMNYNKFNIIEEW